MTPSSPQDSDSDCYWEEPHFLPASQAFVKEDSELIKTVLIERDITSSTTWVALAGDVFALKLW